MTYIATQGLTPDGTVVLPPISGRAKGTSTVLAANGMWSSGWIAIDNYIGVATTLYSDQTGSYTLEYSEDGVNVGQMPAVTVQYVLVSQTRKGSFSPSAKYVRFTYTNGSTAQTKFIFNIDLNETQTQASAETLNAVGADTRMATWNKSRLETKDSGGTYDYIDRTGRSLNVNVTNQTSSQPVTAASLPLPAGASTSANQTTSNTSLNNIDTDLGAPSDTMVTDPTQSASVIALLKGLLQESVAQASSGTFSSVSLAANVAQSLAANSNGKGKIISSTSGTIMVAVGFTATANNWSYRLVTNGTVEIRPEWGALSVSLFATSASTVNVTVLA